MLILVVHFSEDERGKKGEFTLGVQEMNPLLIPCWCYTFMLREGFSMLSIDLIFSYLRDGCLETPILEEMLEKGFSRA